MPHRPETPINQCIDSSDPVVTILSTVAFDALVRGRPVILLDCDNILASAARWFRSERDHLAEGNALVAVDGSGLVRALRDILHDQPTRDALCQARERFLAKHLRYDAREARQRFCRILTES